MYHQHSDEMVQMAMGMMGMSRAPARPTINDHGAVLTQLFASLNGRRRSGKFPAHPPLYGRSGRNHPHASLAGDMTYACDPFLGVVPGGRDQNVDVLRVQTS